MAFVTGIHTIRKSHNDAYNKHSNMDQQEVLGDAVLAGYMRELGASLTLVESDDISDLKFVNTTESEGDYLDDMIDDKSPSLAQTGIDETAGVDDVDDSEFLETKLRGYELVKDLTSMYPGDHMRITQNKYRQSGRKCSYIVLKRYDADAGVWWVNGFKSSYPDWKINVKPLNRYKQVRFYRKIPVPHTGRCRVCTRKVKSPYNLCYDCRNDRRN